MNEARLLLVEDNEDIRTEWIDYLPLYGFVIQGAGSLESMHMALSTGHFDLLILDLGLPDGDALSAVELLRARFGLALGIIITTARGEIEDRVEGLSCGADSYLVKPVNPRELKATIQQLLKRLHSPSEPSTSPTSWRLVPAACLLFSPDGTRISLTGAESVFIQCLLQANGDTVSRNRIAKALGKQPDSVDGRWLDPMVSRLRHKVNSASQCALPVTTFRNRGFAFAERGLIASPH